MSTSESETGEEGTAEPVDAEFEPAPDGGADKDESGEPKQKPRKGAGWFKVSLFVIAAASVGGGSGWVVGHLMQAPLIASFLGLDGQTGGTRALETRLTALENAEPGVTSADLDALQARIAALEEAQNASGLRADALEQLVRDLAGLRDRVAALEAAPAPQPDDQSGQGGAAPQGDSVSQAALAELETRLTEAVAGVETRLDEALDVAQGAASAASEARAAARNALEAAAQSDSPGEAGASGPQPDTAALDALAAEIEALQSALSDLQADQSAVESAAREAARNAAQTAARNAVGDRTAALETLSSRLSELESSAAQASAVNRLGRRISAVEESLSDLEAASQSARSAASAGEDLAARALAFADLREAASGAAPFAVEHAALRRVWPSAPGLSDLAAVAADGAPPLEALTARFPAAALREVSGEARTYLGVLTVRRDGAEGPAAGIEAALQAGDLSQALQIADTLEGEAAAAIADWRETARARQTIETALASMNRALQTREERAQ